MQGKVITYSNGQGLILAKVGQYGQERPFPFSATDFMGYDIPKVGQKVDFELNAKGRAVMITRLLRNKVTALSIDYA